MGTASQVDKQHNIFVINMSSSALVFVAKHMILKVLVFCVPLYLNNNSILFESLCKIISIVSNNSNNLTLTD